MSKPIELPESVYQELLRAAGGRLRPATYEILRAEKGLRASAQ